MRQIITNMSGKIGDIECIGNIIYRASVSTYMNNSEIGFRIRLRKLKRLSCKCNKCLRSQDCVNEFVSQGIQIKGLNEVEHDKLYTIMWGLEPGNPYVGESDEYYLIITPYYEKN